MNPVEEVGKQAVTWAEFGLAGLVIMALFILLGWTIYLSNKERDRTSATHKEERTEWRESSERQVEKLGNAIDGISSAIREHKI